MATLFLNPLVMVSFQTYSVLRDPKTLLLSTDRGLLGHCQDDEGFPVQCFAYSDWGFREYLWPGDYPTGYVEVSFPFFPIKTFLLHTNICENMYQTTFSTSKHRQSKTYFGSFATKHSASREC